MKVSYFCFFLATLSTTLSSTPLDRSALLVVDIAAMSAGDLDGFKASPQVGWWIEAGDELLVAPTSLGMRSALSASQLVKRTLTYRSVDELAVVHSGHANELGEGVKFLLKGGRSVIILKSDTVNLAHSDHGHFLVEPVQKNLVLSSRLREGAPSGSAWSESQQLRAKYAAGLIDGDRWFDDVKKLAEWNRHISADGNKEARSFITRRFEEMEGLSVSAQEFRVGNRPAWNVIATHMPADKEAQTILVTGHYDSTSQSVGTSAPGAEDNATGAAGVLELARMVTASKLDMNFVFIAFSGEEQGLVGSKAYVNGLDAQSRARIQSVINMDMIGYSKDDSLDVLLETSRQFESLSNHLAQAAKNTTTLRVYRTYNPWGSDHMPFIDRNIPAILTIDNDWGDYPAYHRTTDTIDKVSRAMGLEILRMNAAAIAAWN